MDNTAKKLKSIIKNPDGGKPPFGSNPLDPWSTKANISEAGNLNDYLSSRGINPKFVSRDTKISHAKSAEFQKWKNDRKMTEETLIEASEEELLARYLNSRGINPRYVTRDVKIAHSKSGEYNKWKRDHMTDESVVVEETDKVDTITVDIPLMIRLLELAREDVKDDMELHKITERLIEIRSKGMLSMADYDFIANGKAKIKEEVLDEAKKPKPTALDKWRKAADEREKKHNTAPTGDMKGAIDKLEKHLNKEEAEQIDETPGAQAMKASGVKQSPDKLLARTGMNMAHKFPRKGQTNLGNIPGINTPGVSKDTADYAEKRRGDRAKELKPAIKAALGTHGPKGKLPEEVEQIAELKKSTVFSWLKKQPVVPEKKPGMDKKAHNQRIKTHSKSWNRALDRLSGYKPTSENTLDSLAATEAPCDGVNGGETTDRKSQMSKSARMIKSLYKKHGMKEETYDWEKDDKSSQSKPYGKKPKVDASDKVANAGENKPEARAVMKGGTTLTGQPRDMVEIDPSMKNRPDRPDTFDKGYPKKSPV
jgi:hypothetical protein